ncbi:MAG TPA: response regulator [Bacteroidetes bacterium]|nr:response regulator [Bacteroidota bacterium]
MAKRILIIEDYPHIVDILRMRLESSGYEVLSAYDGKEGLRKAREEKPDLIILDVMLPKLNGFKVCRLLKFDAKYQHIPIFMLTSRKKQSDIETGKETGAEEYIVKPYEISELMELIERYLGA